MIDVRYRSKVWGHLERNQKYSLDIVNVINNYSSWKRTIFNRIST